MTVSSVSSQHIYWDGFSYLSYILIRTCLDSVCLFGLFPNWLFVKCLVLPSGLFPSGVMWSCFYSSSCLCNASFCFSVDTGIPCRYTLGFLLFPYRFVLVAVLPVVTFCTLIGLFPDIYDSLLLQQYLQIFALQHIDLRRLALQLVFPLEV